MTIIQLELNNRELMNIHKVTIYSYRPLRTFSRTDVKQCYPWKFWHRKNRIHTPMKKIYWHTKVPPKKSPQKSIFFHNPTPNFILIMTLKNGKLNSILFKVFHTEYEPWKSNINEIWKANNKALNTLYILRWYI